MDDGVVADGHFDNSTKTDALGFPMKRVIIASSIGCIGVFTGTGYKR